MLHTSNFSLISHLALCVFLAHGSNEFGNKIFVEMLPHVEVMTSGTTRKYEMKLIYIQVIEVVKLIYKKISPIEIARGMCCEVF